MRLLTTLAVLLLLGQALPAAAEPRDVREALARFSLVPVGPGGSHELLPLYELAELPAARFEVYLSAEINGQNIDEYLAERAMLMGARYRVYVYRYAGRASPQLNPADWDVLAAADSTGTFSFEQIGLKPGDTCAWRLAAFFTDSAGQTIAVHSNLLYFRVAGADSQLPPAAPAEARTTIQEVLLLSSWQERAAAALSLELAGHPQFAILPEASDTYTCLSLRPELSSPWLGFDAEYFSRPAEFSYFGWELTETLRLQQLLRNGADVSSGVHELIGRLRPYLADMLLAARLPWATQQRFRELNDVCLSVELATETALADELLSQLSQLALALDAVVGNGTVNLDFDYSECFLKYAVGSSRRLERLELLAPQLAAYLGAEQAGFWADYFRAERAELGLLMEDVERRRLSKAQLSTLLKERGQLTLPLPLAGPSLLSEGECAVAPEWLKGMQPGNEFRISEISGQLLDCRFRQFAGQLWPRLP